MIASQSCAFLNTLAFPENAGTCVLQILLYWTKIVVSCFDIRPVLPHHAKIQIELLCSWGFLQFSVCSDTEVMSSIFKGAIALAHLW